MFLKLIKLINVKYITILRKKEERNLSFSFSILKQETSTNIDNSYFITFFL